MLIVSLAICAAAAAEPDLLDAQQLVFRSALQTVQPSIVRIETIGGALPVGQRGTDGGGSAAVSGFRQADGPTTGVICSADGYILTSSFNFIRDPAVITVMVADGRRFVAELVARDVPARLALLKVDAVDLPVPRWLPAEELHAGQWALAAGYGHGSEAPAISIGVLSALARLDGRAVQSDVKTSPANYGGPLFDIEGRLIGICVPKAGKGDDIVAGVEWYDSGIGFAIRSEYIEARLPRLKNGEDLQSGFLGVRLELDDPVVGGTGEEAPVGGVRIVAVPFGPAADAGLQPEDVITRIDDQPVPRVTAVARMLARRTAGDTIRVTYRRGEAEATVTLMLAGSDLVAAGAAAPATTQPAPNGGGSGEQP